MMLLEKIIDAAASLKASDIHIVNNMWPVFRINGELTTVDMQSFQIASFAQNDILSEISLSDAQLALLNEKGDVDLSYRTVNGVNTRVNVSKSINGYNWAFRIINTSIPTNNELHLPLPLVQFSAAEHGLVLVCGPTGSGKSTTIASLIDNITQHEAKRIITIEDPVEYYFNNNKSLVTQREVGKDCASFYQGLKAAMRQDPDVILVGELRDRETIATALAAAETGHLVFSTLHSGDTTEAIDRLIQYFPAESHVQIRNEIANSLVGIAIQRLLPCTKGGRIAAFELLSNTSAIANLIRKNEIFQFKNYMYHSEGMQTMAEAIEGLKYKKLVAAELSYI